MARTNRDRPQGSGRPQEPAGLVSLEISLQPPPGSPILPLFGTSERAAATNVTKFHADRLQMDLAAEALQRLGFRVVSRSRLSLSVEATPELCAKTFEVKLELRSLREHGLPARPAAMEFLAASSQAKWQVPTPLRGLVEQAYIQFPFLYFGSPLPPRVAYHHLCVPGDVALLTNAARVHREGTTGRGVRVAMIDSGFFFEHRYYQLESYNLSRMLGPSAKNLDHDEQGHGTADMANILSIAPDVNFVGVKVGPSLAAAFKETVKQNPEIVSISLGWDLRGSGGLPLPKLPGAHRALEAEIADAVAAGITVVVSAGNGHISFPGMHPDVISAGGAFIDETLDVQASDYASAFHSVVYPGRSVPDVVGLVGMQPNANYIMLPLEPSCAIDRDASQYDGTAGTDGWVVVSGTSAAAPQLAGLCALLKQKNPGLRPSDLKAVLQRTARAVKRGHANPTSNPVLAGGAVKYVPIQAAAGPAGATGHGLVDAFAAWQQV